MGNNQVEGLDYAYTIHGWLKGVNSTNVILDFDMGSDDKTGSLNNLVARHACGLISLIRYSIA